jgi:hypothetical protein
MGDWPVWRKAMMARGRQVTAFSSDSLPQSGQSSLSQPTQYSHRYANFDHQIIGFERTLKFISPKMSAYLQFFKINRKQAFN